MTTSTSSDKGFFPVAAKVFLRDGDKLLILHDIFDDWDIPGGRLLHSEFMGDIKDVIARKIREELGDEIKYEVGDFDTFFQVERIEHDTGKPLQIFGIGFTVNYLGGDIKLGPHHDKLVWVDMKSFKPSDYFQHGWEKGIERYIARNI